MTPRKKVPVWLIWGIVFIAFGLVFTFLGNALATNNLQDQFQQQLLNPGGAGKGQRGLLFRTVGTLSSLAGILTLAFGPIIQGLNTLQEIGEEVERWRRQQAGEEPEAPSDLSDSSDQSDGSPE